MIVCRRQLGIRPLRGSLLFRREAFTLIEVAIAVSILSVVLALSMTTLVALFRVERQYAADARLEQAIARLAVQFRDDAHLALAAEVNSVCKFTHPADCMVEYKHTDSGVSRVVSQSGETVHRDSFLVGRGARISFTFAPEALDRRLLQLRIGPAIDSQAPRAASIRPLTIEAAMDLHRRGTTEEMPP